MRAIRWVLLSLSGRLYWDLERYGRSVGCLNYRKGKWCVYSRNLVDFKDSLHEAASALLEVTK